MHAYHRFLYRVEDGSLELVVEDAGAGSVPALDDKGEETKEAKATW